MSLHVDTCQLLGRRYRRLTLLSLECGFRVGKGKNPAQEGLCLRWQMFTLCQENAPELNLIKEVPAACWLPESDQVLAILIGVDGGSGQGERGVVGWLCLCLPQQPELPSGSVAGLIAWNLSSNPAGFLASLSLGFHICEIAMMVHMSRGGW